MSFHFTQDKFWNPTLSGWAPILQPDKWIHLFEFAWLYSVFYFAAYHWGVLSSLAIIVGHRTMAAVFSWLLSFAYEIVQGFRKEGFSWRDLIANTIGIGSLWLISP